MAYTVAAGTTIPPRGPTVYMEETAMKRPFRLTLAMMAIFGLACGQTLPGEADIDVEQCSGNTDVDDATLITWEFKDSAHEMITCGSLTFQFLFALIETAETILTEPTSLPSAFSYADGLYTTTGTGVAMDLSFRYGPDTPGGTPGEIVPYNVFSLDSYLTGATSREENDAVVIAFSEPGPLAALLGKGAAPQSPLTFNESDLAVIAANISSLKLKSVIFVDDERTTSVITYEINNPAVFVTEALAGMQMSMELVNAATGARADLGQSLETTKWDVVYGDLAGTLDGTIEADVTGGPFDFRVVYEYLPTFVEPSISITCL